MAEQQAADAESTEEEADYEERPWVNITPTTRLSGEVIDIFAKDFPTSDKEQTDSMYGIVVQNPEVVVGNVYRNNHKPEDGLTRDVVDEDSSSPTDYRVADESDKSANVVGDTLVTDEESMVDGEQANQYDEGAFEEDEVLLWVGGMSGERLIRALDFNGQPFARYIENDGEPYLIKGLFQAHEDWFSDQKSRGQAAKEGHAPRLNRPPILRPDVEGEHLLIDISRGNGRGYYGHVFVADDFDGEVGGIDTPTDDLPKGQYGLDVDSELDLRQVGFDEADATIEDNDLNMHAMFFEGPGWGEQPDGVDTSVSTGFDTGLDIGESSDSGQDDTAQDEEFALNVVEAMKATDAAHGLTPDEVYKQGLTGKIDQNSSEWSEIPTGDRLQNIREIIYSELSWLDASELET